MNEQNEKRAERLFDAIGGIDDMLIQNAMSPARAREHISQRRRTRFSLVAAACVCCIITVTLLSIPNLGTQPSTNAPVDSDSIASVGSQQSPEGNGSMLEDVPHSLEYALSQGHSSQRVLRLSGEEIDLHDNSPKLIWQIDGEEYYNVAPISKASTLDSITTQLDRPLADLSAEESEQISVKAWIAYGDGRVDSPYLKHTAGNTGYGVLFDYCAEVEPSSELTDTILDLIQ